MGDMAGYYDERTDDTGPEYGDDLPRRKRSRPARAGNESHHHPATDKEAKELIKSLGTFEWTTTRAKHFYTEDPYRLYADIAGIKHIIHLPGRHGSTLQWLKTKRDNEATKED